MLYCARRMGADCPETALSIPLTPRPLHLHLVAIGGTGMAPLACLLQAQGHFVTGSDGPLYPPMSQLLEAAGIRPQVGYRADHLSPAPDIVIIGNAVRSDNPEALETERLGLPRLSMPEALARFFLADRRPLVIAGTHGKTTTSAMAAWVWSQCGRDPGFLIGGVPIDLGVSFRRGSGPRFVVEGDEYNAAYFDRGAKFLHYRPETLLLTSVEYDHADLYPSPQALAAAYARLIALVPASGLVVACGDSAEVRALAGAAQASVVFYGEDEANAVRLLGVPDSDAAGIRFRLRDESGQAVEIAMPLWGVHNAVNALAVWAAGRREGLGVAELRSALAGFRGVKRRQELLADHGGIVVVDDFAHHPTAVEKTLASMRMRFPGRRLLACFEPRSLTAGRAFLLAGYARAFRSQTTPSLLRSSTATASHPRIGSISRLSRPDCRAPVHLAWWRTTSSRWPPGSSPRRELGMSCSTMSSGSFGGLPRRLADAVAAAG